MQQNRRQFGVSFYFGTLEYGVAHKYNYYEVPYVTHTMPYVHDGVSMVSGWLSCGQSVYLRKATGD